MLGVAGGRRPATRAERHGGMARGHDKGGHRRASPQLCRFGKMADGMRRVLRWSEKREFHLALAREKRLPHHWNLPNRREPRAPERGIQELPARRGFSQYANFR